MRRWLIAGTAGTMLVGGAVGAALIVATGGALRDAPSTIATPAPETRVVDLALPGTEAVRDQAPGGHLEPRSDAVTTASREPPPDSLPLSRPHLETAADGPIATPSASPAAAPAESAPETIAAASIEPSLPAPAAQAHPAAGEATTTAVVEPSSRGDALLPAEDEAAAPAEVEPSPAAAPAPTHRVTVKRGDSLSLIFKRLGLPQRDLARMTGSKPLAKKLARIAPHQEIEIHVDAESRLIRLVHRLDRIRSRHFFRDGDAFKFEEVVEPPDVSVATATGIIDSSLFEAGQRVGLSDNIIMQMAEIFAWDVDFALDIRAGDRFALIFEEQYKGEEKIGEGPIIAAKFTNRGRPIRAVRYVDSTDRADYFSPDGRSMRKAFLRTPVNFTRISSRFNLTRRHPILHRIRAHRGVDYAAPRGTAVKASGDGKVTFAGRKGGYGRTIIVKHGSAYTTLYAHLKGFSKGIRPGRRVRQGQTIGYVGSTGLATGPHLHYEFRVRGVHRDPLKVKFPKAAPLADKYMADFQEKAEPLFANLDRLERTSLAVVAD